MAEFSDMHTRPVRTKGTDGEVFFHAAEDSSLQVQAYWEPIQDSTYNLHTRSPQHSELFNLTPAQPIKEYRAHNFKAFLPTNVAAVGDVWALSEADFLPFLRQFHPGAIASLHHSTGQEGGFACLRALSSRYAEFVFRIHAEFKLDEPTAYFTPAQFAGQLVLDRKEGTVRQFSLYLPSQNSNVDINAFGLADMVFVPRMALIGKVVDDLQEIVWETAIAEEDARKSLESKFYKFAEIEWAPVFEAVGHAKAKNRPIHGIILFGTLDDESC